VTLATHPDVTHGRPWVFRIVGDDVAQARTLATFVHEELQASEYATFVDLSDASSLSAAARFADATAPRGVRELRRVEYSSAAADEAVAASWTELMKARAVPVIFLPTKVRDTARLMRLGRERGFTGTFVGGDGWGNRELMIIAGKSSRGAYFVTHWNPDLDVEGSTDFLERYLAQHRTEPTVGAAAGYDAARTLIAAMRTAGGDDQMKIRDALAAGTFPCTTGTLRFDAEHTALRPMLVLKVGISRFDTHRLVSPEVAP
jgi:branched-chain amino acid transport system substrate-binding protein